MSEEIKELLFLLHNDRLTEAGKRKLEQEIERLNNIIKQIYKIFEEGRFEDNCDCIQIEELITRELKGSDKE